MGEGYNREYVDEPRTMWVRDQTVRKDSYMHAKEKGNRQENKKQTGERTGKQIRNKNRKLNADLNRD